MPLPMVYGIYRFSLYVDETAGGKLYSVCGGALKVFQDPEIGALGRRVNGEMPAIWRGPGPKVWLAAEAFPKFVRVPLGVHEK